MISSVPGSALIPIRFAPGATSAVVSGDLQARSTARYILRALAGQLMDVTLSAPEGVKVSVTNSGWTSLNRGDDPAPPVSGVICPGRGEYIITVASGSQAASYSVNVSIPKRIAFVWGATSSNPDWAFSSAPKPGLYPPCTGRADYGNHSDARQQPPADHLRGGWNRIA